MASHLSDAQMMMGMGKLKEANQRINLVKMIINRHPDTNERVEDKVLSEYWKETLKLFG